MRCLLSVLIGLTAMAAAPSFAQDVNCANPTSQFEMTECAHRSADAADALLNETYRQAMDVARQMDAESQAGRVPLAELLRDAQREWITFRDAACSVESGLAMGGTAGSMMFAECLEKQTLRRIDDLRVVSGY